MVLVWIKFIVCTSLIVYSGYNLSRYGDVIAEKTGLGRTWIGVLLMAGATSLPELITGMSSVTLASAPDIAVGDVMGSSVFNILIVAILDILHGPGPIFSKAETGHILSGGFGIILLSIVTMSLFLYSGGLLGGSYIGIYVPAIIFTYLLAMRTIYRFEMKKIAELISERVEALLYEEIPLKRAYTMYAIHATVIVGAGTWLPFIGTELAEVTGLERTFVGNIFIALSTSLPEVIVSISALKIGAVDMAIGNLFGSNLFNMNILAIDDLLYPAPILSHTSPNHIISGISAIMMTGVAIAGLTYRSEKKAFMRISWDGLSIIALYLLNMFILYLL